MTRNLFKLVLVLFLMTAAGRELAWSQMSCHDLFKEDRLIVRQNTTPQMLVGMGFEQIGSSNFYYFRQWILELKPEGGIGLYHSDNIDTKYDAVSVAFDEGTKAHVVQLFNFEQYGHLSGIGHTKAWKGGAVLYPLLDKYFEMRTQSLAEQVKGSGLVQVVNSNAELFSTNGLAGVEGGLIYRMPNGSIQEFTGSVHKLLNHPQARLIANLSGALRFQVGPYQFTISREGFVNDSTRVLTGDVRDYLNIHAGTQNSPLLLERQRFSEAAVDASTNGGAIALRTASNEIVPIEERAALVVQHAPELLKTEPSIPASFMGNFVDSASPEKMQRQMKEDEESLRAHKLDHKKVGDSLMVVMQLAQVVNEFTWNGVTYKVKRGGIRGPNRMSPFNDGTSTGATFELTNKDTNEKLEFHGLFPSMIARYGFFGTKGAVNRLEPTDVIRILNLTH